MKTGNRSNFERVDYPRQNFSGRSPTWKSTPNGPSPYRNTVIDYHLFEALFASGLFFVYYGELGHWKPSLFICAPSILWILWNSGMATRDEKVSRALMKLGRKVSSPLLNPPTSPPRRIPASLVSYPTPCIFPADTDTCIRPRFPPSRSSTFDSLFLTCGSFTVTFQWRSSEKQADQKVVVNADEVQIRTVTLWDPLSSIDF